MSILAALLLIAAAGQGAPCAITGESIDPDPAGLRVHSGPSLRSPVVGRLYPGVDPESYFHDGKATLAEGLVGANFTVNRVSGDWVHIADIDPVTDGLAPDGSLTLIPNAHGEGWVHASKVRLIPDNGDDLRTAPDGPRAHRALSAHRDARIVGCRGNWAEIGLGSGTGWLPSRSNKARAAKIGAAMRSEGRAR